MIKTKPMYMFMNMLFQKQVTARHTEDTPESAGFEVREDEIDYNHPEGGY